MKNVSSYINAIVKINDKKEFDNAINDFLYILEENYNELELGIFSELLEEAIEMSETLDTLDSDNLMESYGGSVNIPAPKWIAAGGSAALLQWNKITESLSKTTGNIDYRKAISAWKDWEMTIHASRRIKASRGVNLEDIVKKRFVNELTNESNKQIKLVYEPAEMKIRLLDGKNRDMSDYNHSTQYLNSIIKKYNSFFTGGFSKGIIGRIAREKKGTIIAEMKHLSKDPHSRGVITTQDTLSEFVKRVYHSIKNKEKKKKN